VAEQVGGLYVTVGVDAKRAIAEAKLLEKQLGKVAAQLQTLGSGASFAGVTKQLQAVQQQAKTTATTLGNVGKQTGANAGGDAATKAMQQQIDAAHKLALEQEKLYRTQSAQADAILLKRMRADQAMDAANARTYGKQYRQAEKMAADVTRSAQRSADQQVKAQQKASQQRMSIMQAEAIKMNAVFDKEAKAAERAAQREIKAAELAANRRKVAQQRAAADVTSGSAALIAGNPAYAMANFAQAGIKLTGVLSGVTAGTVAMGVAWAALPVTLAAAAAGITFLGVKIAELGVAQASNQEMLGIQFEGLLGSATKAQQEVDYLLQMSTESLVPTQQLMDADRLLLAFGARHQGLRHDMLEFISAFASVTGASQMQVSNLAYSMGQIISIGKVTAQDMRQLGNAGISQARIFKEVAKQQGISRAEAQKWLAEGKLTAAVVIPAILAQTEKLDEAQKKARDSAAGILANIKDIANVKMGQAFGGLLQSLQPVLKWVEEFIEAFDFEYIAKSFQLVVGYFKEAFAGIGADASGTATGISETVGKTINVVGYAAVRIAQSIVAVFDTVMIAVNTVWAVVQGVFAAMMKSVSIITGIAGEVPGPWQDAMKAVSTSSDNAFQGAAEGAGIAAQGIINSAVAAGSAWASMFNQIATFRLPNKDQFATGSPTANYWANFYNPPKPEKPWKPPVIPTLPTGGSKSSGSKKENPEIQRLKDLIAYWKELIATSIKGRDTLRENFAVPFGPKFAEGLGIANEELSKFTAAYKEFTSGDVDSIVGKYKELRQAIEDYYALAEGTGKKGRRKEGRKQRREEIAQLKEYTGELVRLAAERQKINDDLTKLEEKYNDDIDRIGKEREALGKKYAEQQKKINDKYDGYYTATSSTEGSYIAGVIETAQNALDAATKAYEAAQDKLDELKAARQQFMDSIKEMALSFVNDLSKVNEEITRFTRLDSVGSFSSVTESIASTESFTAGLKTRLQALKDFASNVKALTAKGLDSGLLQQILLGGPEQSGALASALAGASSDEIAEINQIQGDLASTITGMQTEASAAWFDAGIAAQEAFTAPLKAAMESAQTQVNELTRQKDLALGILEAWNADQTALLDERQAGVEEQYEKDKKALEDALDANQAAAEDIALQIDERLNGLPTTAYATGLDTIQGMIDGLSDDAKLKELKAAARQMARAITRTVKDELGIESPSTVMIDAGKNVGLGLAVGMGLSEPTVTSAAASLAGAVAGGVGSDGGSLGDMTVKVFIGDTELRDIVGTEVEYAGQRSGSYVMTGRRL